MSRDWPPLWRHVGRKGNDGLTRLERRWYAAQWRKHEGRQPSGETFRALRVTRVPPKVFEMMLDSTPDPAPGLRAAVVTHRKRYRR